MERKKAAVNNDFYDILQDAWYGKEDHPIALLIAENKTRSPWIQKEISLNFTSPCKVLDIGCGGGLLTNYLALQRHEVVGIDLSKSSLEIAKKNDATGTVQYQLESAEKLSFQDESFDVVCAMDLLEHVNDPEAVIKQASRVLKPGGLFFFHTFNRNIFSYLLIIKAVELFVKNTPKDMHLYSHFIKPKELASWCQRSNMQVGSIQGLVPDMKKKAFWKTALTGKIDKDFNFVFSPSLMTGYVGIAKKTQSSE